MRCGCGPEGALNKRERLGACGMFGDCYCNGSLVKGGAEGILNGGGERVGGGKDFFGEPASGGVVLLCVAGGRWKRWADFYGSG